MSNENSSDIQKNTENCESQTNESVTNDKTQNKSQLYMNIPISQRPSEHVFWTG